MKVLLCDSTCAYLTPGGKTTHALKLQQEISRLGIDVQFARWWDESQKDVDIIHFLAPMTNNARLAKERGIRTFFSMIFDFETSKSKIELTRSLIKTRLLTTLPFGWSNRFGYWNALPYMDTIQFMHEEDKRCALRFFPRHINEEKTVVIPHAYSPEDMFISEALDIKEKCLPSKYLVSCANISKRKQTLFLARCAKKAGVPIVFMGSRVESDPYFKSFSAEVDNKYVFYPGYVSKEWKDCIERNAAGYVLLSLGESGCIAVYEAAAYKMPLLLSNLPWAWGYEGPTDIHYCDCWNEKRAVEQLRNFYDLAGRLDHMPFLARTWADVARLYAEQYEDLLK